MKHLHRNVIVIAAIGLAIVAGAYALLGIGLAVMVALGLVLVGVPLFAGFVVFEEETRLPSWRESKERDERGYHPAR